MRILLSLLFICSIGFAQAQNQGSFHEVVQGETLYGISRTYGISIEQLQKFNPDLVNGLKPGMKLFIPASDGSANTPTQDSSSYVLHTVEAGQTLYSLAKQYGVEYAEIKALNLALEDGLKVGMRLRIPKKDLAKPSAAKRDSNSVYHTVKAGETAYSLSRQYNISLDSLYLLNPQVEGVLRIGDELRFPAKAEATKTAQPTEKLNSDATTKSVPDDEKYFLYKLKSGDTYYSLKKRFKVDRAELLRLNPELEDRSLTEGLYIIVPKNSDLPDAVWLEQIIEEVKTETKVEDEKPEKAEKVQVDLSKVEVDRDQLHRVAVLLPFYASDPSDTAYGLDLKFEKKSVLALEFYQGLLLAADSLSKSGMQLRLEVYDTKNSTFTVKERVRDLELNPTELVIGPLYSDHVETVADALRDEGVPVVSPLSNAVDVKGRENLIMCVPNQGEEARQIGKILNGFGGEVHVIFAHTGKGEELESIKLVKSHIKAGQGKVSFGELVGLPERSYIVGSRLRESMRFGKKNVIVLLSEQEVFLADVVNRIYSMRDTSLSVIASPKVLNIPTLDYKYLNAINLYMPEAHHLDSEDPRILAFEKAYSEAYGMLPSKYAFHGYDVGLYFLSQLWYYGPYFSESLSMERELNVTGFRLIKVRGGGYNNSYMLTTRLRNFEIVKKP